GDNTNGTRCFQLLPAFPSGLIMRGEFRRNPFWYPRNIDSNLSLEINAADVVIFDFGDGKSITDEYCFCCDLRLGVDPHADGCFATKSDILSFSIANDFDGGL